MRIFIEKRLIKLDAVAGNDYLGDVICLWSLRMRIAIKTDYHNICIKRWYTPACVYLKRSQLFNYAIVVGLGTFVHLWARKKYRVDM